MLSNWKRRKLEGVNNYYDKPQGSLIERLSMIPPDDELFSFSAKGHYEGMAPVYEYFSNLLPHVLNPNKTMLYSGNFMPTRWGLVLLKMIGVREFRTALSVKPFTV